MEQNWQNTSNTMIIFEISDSFSMRHLSSSAHAHTIYPDALKLPTLCKTQWSTHSPNSGNILSVLVVFCKLFCPEWSARAEITMNHVQSKLQRRLCTETTFTDTLFLCNLKKLSGKNLICQKICFPYFIQLPPLKPLRKLQTSCVVCLYF